MAKLIRVLDNGQHEFVDSTARLSGIQDAALIAAHAGDGEYIFDAQQGNYLPFTVADGRVVQFTPDAFQQGEPAADLNRAALGDTIDDSVSMFGAIFPDENSLSNQPIEDSRPAVEVL